MSVFLDPTLNPGIVSRLSFLAPTSILGKQGYGQVGAVPSLALDFLAGTLDSRITFARTDASTCATYFGSDGLLKTAAANVPRFDYDPVTKLPKGLLIEESRTNLLANPAAPYTSWTDNGSTATAGASALGLFSNTTIVASGGQVYNRRNTTLSAAWVSGTTYAWTVFVIPGTSGKILIDFRDATAVTETQITGTFPATPTATATAAGAATVIGMVSVGGGVYQITGTFTPNSTPANGGASMFGVGPNTTTVGQNITVLGAQVEVGAFPTSFINGQLTRAADSASMQGPVVTTNILPYSSQFDNAAWAKNRSSITADVTAAPDGTNTADKLVEDSTASATHYVFEGAAVSSGVSYTYSAFVKPAERTWCGITFFNTNGAFTTGSAYFNLTNGTLYAKDAPVTSAGIQSVGGGWYRVWATQAALATVSGNVSISLSVANGSLSYTGDGASGLYIWGAQLEQASTPGPYVATQATSASYYANFSSWFNATAGTFVAEWDSYMTPTNAQFPHVFSASDGTTANTLEGYFTNSTINSFEVKVSSVSQALLGLTNVFVANNVMKSCGTYAANDFNAAVNGTLPSRDSSGSLPTATTLYIGANGAGSGAFVNGHIRRLAYYPKRLDNTLLQGLTL